ncbi:MAG: NosD domain-containing protein, partial [Candidatus Heimdallarchaeaceae archaeon]
MTQSKEASYVLVVALISILGFSVILNSYEPNIIPQDFNGKMINNQSFINLRNSFNIQSLTPHAAIDITSDDDFLVFPGEGTLEDPYRIEDLNITTAEDFGISILGTTKYFIIQHCYLEALYTGIRIDTITSGTCTIFNNTCVNNGADGILLRESDNVNITGNTCFLNGRNGIYVDYYSDFAVIVNNTCNNNNGDGIYFYFLSNSGQVINNTCNFNTLYGICITMSSSCKIIQNECHNNDYGIVISGYTSPGSCINTLCENNTVTGSTTVGIFLISEHGELNNNTLKNNPVGIHLAYGSNNNVVRNNDIIIKDNPSYRLFGIWVVDSPQNSLYNNTCTAERYIVDDKSGIVIESSSSMIVEKNLCFSLQYGIDVFDSSAVLITNNTCYNNSESGIRHDRSNLATLSYNLCYNNSIYGIEIIDSASSQIFSNICYDNIIGIYVQSSGSPIVTENICYYN